MGVLGAVVQVAVLARLHPRQDLALRRVIALQFLHEDHAWAVLAPLEEIAEALLRSLLIPPPLPQDIALRAVLIHCPP